MQLVLDDEIGRVERPAIVELACPARARRRRRSPTRLEAVDMAEERAGLAYPWKAGELVDGRDQERGQAAIDRLVDGQDRQRPIAREVAGRIRAADHHIARRASFGMQAKTVA